MKTARFFWYSVLLVLFALLLFLLLGKPKLPEERTKVKETSDVKDWKQLSETTLKTSSSKKTGLSEISKIHVLSDITNSTNRVIVAEKDGVTKTAQVPLSMQLSDEQILYGLFYDDSKNIRRRPNPQQSLNQNLVFYGVAVDEQTNYLAGVTIIGKVLVADGKSPLREVPIETMSDVTGLFQIKMAFGQAMWLTVAYGTNYLSPPTQWFRYGPKGYGPFESLEVANPDPNDPFVFVLTKKQPVGELITLRKGLMAPNTGNPVRINLVTGEIVQTGGDFLVSITCLEPFQAGVHIPWKLVLTAVDGGFVPSNAQRLEYMEQAPESGYEEISVEYTRDNPNWRSQYDGMFYLKAHNGQMFGKMAFSTHIQWDERGVGFRFFSTVSTNNSRYLHTEP